MAEAIELCGGRRLAPKQIAQRAIETGDVRALSDVIDSLSIDESTQLLYQACILEDISASNRIGIVDALLRSKVKINTVFSLRGKAALHLCAERGYNTILNLLLKGGASIHVRTSSYESALHCAIRGCQEGKCNEYSALNCIQLLISNHINIDARDKIGEYTAVHLAAKFGFENITKYLLECKAHIDVDINGETARKIIQEKWKLSLLYNPYRNELPKDLTTQLFSLLTQETQNQFVDYIINNKGHFEVNDTDGHRTLLQTAVWEDLEGAVKSLLELGANVNQVTQGGEERSPILLACHRGYHHILRELLKMEDCDLSVIDNEYHKYTALHVALTGNAYKPIQCVRLLLRYAEKYRLNINAKDFMNYTALHYAAKLNDDECIQVLLENKANIFIQDYENIPAFFYIDPEQLNEFLNERITLEDSVTSEKYALVFHYDFLKSISTTTNEVLANGEHVYVPVNNLPHDKIPEMDNLKLIASSPEHRHLLNHPLIRSFLYLKWQRIYWFFYINFFIYFIFTTALSVHIFYLVNQNTTNITNETVNENESMTEEKEDSYDAYWWYATLVLAGLLLIREISQIFMSFWRYIGHAENWLELCLLGVTFSLLFLPNDVLCAIAILLAYIELVLLAGRHPALAAYITMFLRVSASFICFLLWYSILIVAFGLSFHIMFRHCEDENECKENFFINIGTSMFKTIVMLTGEFEAGDIKFESYSIFSHIIFVLFVFFIAIVLLNLLNGLAVSDTQAIRNEADILNCIAQVNLYSKIEYTLLGSHSKPSNNISSLILLMPRLRSESTGKYELRVMLNKDNALEPDLRDCFRHCCSFNCCILRRSSKLRRVCRWCRTSNTIVSDARAIASKHGRLSDQDKILKRLDELEQALKQLSNHFVTRL